MATGPKIENFSVPAGDGITLRFDVDPDAGVNLIGSNIIWRAYAQAHGVRDVTADPVIEKILDDGLQITDPDELLFEVTLDRVDTLNLLRNYYHEASVIDEDGVWVTVTAGVMTVTATENRESGE